MCIYPLPTPTPCVLLLVTSVLFPLPNNKDGWESFKEKWIDTLKEQGRKSPGTSVQQDIQVVIKKMGEEFKGESSPVHHWGFPPHRISISLKLPAVYIQVPPLREDHPHYTYAHLRPPVSRPYRQG